MTEPDEKSEESPITPSKEIAVKISSDSMSAYVTIITQDNNVETSTEEINDALNKKGVVFGIRDGIVSKICSEKKYNLEQIVAEGKPAEVGCDASIVYKIEKGKP